MTEQVVGDRLGHSSSVVAGAGATPCRYGRGLPGFVSSKHHTARAYASRRHGGRYSSSQMVSTRATRPSVRNSTSPTTRYLSSVSEVSSGT